MLEFYLVDDTHVVSNPSKENLDLFRKASLSVEPLFFNEAYLALPGDWLYRLLTVDSGILQDSMLDVQWLYTSMSTYLSAYGTSEEDLRRGKIYSIHREGRDWLAFVPIDSTTDYQYVKPNGTPLWVPEMGMDRFHTFNGIVSWRGLGTISQGGILAGSYTPWKRLYDSNSGKAITTPNGIRGADAVDIGLRNLSVMHYDLHKRYQLLKADLSNSLPRLDSYSLAILDLLEKAPSLINQFIKLCEENVHG